ncbi:MAG: hypothetical protein ACKO85_12895 [Isosphaeraceae bacterium]
MAVIPVVEDSGKKGLQGTSQPMLPVPGKDKQSGQQIADRQCGEIHFFSSWRTKNGGKAERQGLAQGEKRLGPGLGRLSRFK